VSIDRVHAVDFVSGFMRRKPLQRGKSCARGGIRPVARPRAAVLGVCAQARSAGTQTHRSILQLHGENDRRSLPSPQLRFRSKGEVADVMSLCHHIATNGRADASAYGLALARAG